MKIFNEMSLSEFLRNRVETALQGVKRASENEILGPDLEECVKVLLAKYRIEPLVFDWSGVQASGREEMVSASRVPGFFGGHAGEQVQVQVVTFHVPYTGAFDLLRAKPSSRLGWTWDITHYGAPKTEISFDVHDMEGDSKKVRADADGIISKIKSQLTNLNGEVEKFNSDLPQQLEEAVQTRRDNLRSQAASLGSVGFPIRKKT